MARLRYVMIFCFIAAGYLCTATPAWGQQADSEGDRILGVWLTSDGKAHIALYRTGEEYSGRINWLKEPEEDGLPAVDDQNPDENLRGRPILNMEMMYGFKYDGDDEWVGGKVYDPEGGDEYRAKLELVDDRTLELRGYIMIPLFGRTETWTRVK